MKQEIKEETIELIVKVKINYFNKKEREEVIKDAQECVLLGHFGFRPESVNLFVKDVTPELKTWDIAEVNSTEFIENLKSTINFNAKNVKIKVKDGFIIIGEISNKIEDVTQQIKVGDIVELVSMNNEIKKYKKYIGMRGQVENVLGTTAKIRLENSIGLTPYLTNLKLVTSSNTNEMMVQPKEESIKFGDFLLNNYRIYRDGKELVWANDELISLSTKTAYKRFKNPPPPKPTPEELKFKETEEKAKQWFDKNMNSFTSSELYLLTRFMMDTDSTENKK